MLHDTEIIPVDSAAFNTHFYTSS